MPMAMMMVMAMVVVMVANVPVTAMAGTSIGINGKRTEDKYGRQRDHDLTQHPRLLCYAVTMLHRRTRFLNCQ